MLMFKLEPGDHEKIDHWLKTIVYPPIVAKQKLDPDIAQFIWKDADGNEMPYLGAIGEGLTYSFTPTGLGIVTKVQFYTGDTLDLTDYDW